MAAESISRRSKTEKLNPPVVVFVAVGDIPADSVAGVVVAAILLRGSDLVVLTSTLEEVMEFLRFEVGVASGARNNGELVAFVGCMSSVRLPATRYSIVAAHNSTNTLTTISKYINNDDFGFFTLSDIGMRHAQGFQATPELQACQGFHPIQGRQLFREVLALQPTQAHRADQVLLERKLFRAFHRVR
ncbi:hypothetical protein NECAME_10373 [Necator americanus]|uniref:Uncharacterized protein n=1 Tax=Necator americanus TaxID=51031 RepID=W2T969_NECAM|nr:hypothetical protein NECAME_10373 [Necator americanus]ETN78403.1 hypothetical protein NECAME_10373 [Necator americanus]